jgi:hypothetical protein
VPRLDERWGSLDLRPTPRIDILQFLPRSFHIRTIPRYKTKAQSIAQGSAYRTRPLDTLNILTTPAKQST